MKTKVKVKAIPAKATETAYKANSMSATYKVSFTNQKPGRGQGMAYYAKINVHK